jgi:hypothetical protein
VFLHSVGFAGHVVHSGPSGARSIDALFLMLGWDRYGLHKKHDGTRDAVLVFLHPFWHVGHVVLSDASGPWNIDALFSCSSETGTDSTTSVAGHVTPNLCFCIQWDMRILYCILVRPGHETSMHYFSFLGGTGMDFINSAPGHVTPILCFFIWWDMRVT